MTPSKSNTTHFISFRNFIRWYCYPSQSITMTTLAGQLELQRQLLPLQNHVDRQLFNARVQCVLEVFCSINHTDDDHVHRVDDSIYDSSSHYLVRNVCNFYLSFQRIPTPNCWTKHETVEFHSFLNLGTSGKIKLDSRHLSEIELKIKHHCNSIRQTFILTIVVISCVHQIIVWSEANVVLTYFRAYLLREVSWRSWECSAAWRDKQCGDSSASASTSTISRTASEQILTTRSLPMYSFRRWLR